ncbi:MAG: hypothetical protein WCO19_04095 [Candidatus Saccharibacteria bacterium]
MGKSDDTSVSEAQAGGKHKKLHKLRLHGFNLFSVIVFIVAMGFLGFKIIHRKQTVQSDCGGQATSPLYEEAAKNLNVTTIKKLKVTVDKIAATKGYLEDANCLYPILYYHLANSDAPNAKATFAQLKKAYNPKIKMAKSYAGYAKSITDIEDQMKQFDKGLEQLKSNRTFF